MSKMSERIAEKAASKVASKKVSFQELYQTGGMDTKSSESSKEDMTKEATDEKCSCEGDGEMHMSHEHGETASKEEFSSFEKTSDKWKKKPKGWDQKSLEKYQKSMTSSNILSGDVTDCIKKIKNQVDDPGAFCASLEDAIKGTAWRHHKRKHKSSDTLADLAERLIEQPVSVSATRQIVNELNLVANALSEQ